MFHNYSTKNLSETLIQSSDAWTRAVRPLRIAAVLDIFTGDYPFCLVPYPTKENYCPGTRLKLPTTLR